MTKISTVIALMLSGLTAVAPLTGQAQACQQGVVYLDRDGNGRRGSDEAGMPGIRVSNGRDIVHSDARGRYRLPAALEGMVFVIKPAGYSLPRRSDGMPSHWVGHASSATCDFALQAEKHPPLRDKGLRVLVFGDPQPKSSVDVGHYARGIVDRVIDDAAAKMHGVRMTWAGQVADLGLTLGDVVDDDLSLYPAIKRETARMHVPWLHAPGNHDINLESPDDARSLDGFHDAFGPDTFVWEEPEANFIVLDDVIWQPDASPKYIGGLRDAQFAFLEAYLAHARKDRLLVLSMHIPLFEGAGRDTFRDADRERLFSLLKDFPHVLLLSAHSHTQQHVFHGAETGWHGANPLHEYNVGATCGAFWSGVKDAQGVPVSTMADGTPKGWARLLVQDDGHYALSYHPAVDPAQTMHLHAPKVLRRGAYPAWGVYANVYMADDDSVIEYRVDGGEWQPMRKVMQPDPVLVAENFRDDQADALRDYDRSPEAAPSPHLWRGALPTDLAVGAHQVEVRASLQAGAVHSGTVSYRLDDAMP
ncbi:calcineurin-like phosphoesterase C-terminal domain-containing protein [Solilutibacter tolerans]|uniref:3',5'-cyclic AMP phosphodiesterase CpdA n=1 Tax=Solilutibacter tolerans TaxID=1604334 RepID=A0A1N6X6Y8_9GAMM|nr:calcineurin-like phosphoesterase C-terminal domain-containing protein [Lysobacter tolerans]SIQ98132.1 3',5'-cyclic AMP phosphodiesterase CpdA [Lysobacter tolerans]